MGRSQEYLRQRMGPCVRGPEMASEPRAEMLPDIKMKVPTHTYLSMYCKKYLKTYVS
jgi:hypothetical protein